MSRPAKKEATKSDLHQPSPMFPWRTGDIVEMKTNEIGYRGAWFRVEIKNIRHGKQNKLHCRVVYKDFPDERAEDSHMRLEKTAKGEEEIIGMHIHPLTKEYTLMFRPLPPQATKESTYDETKELNTVQMVFRDFWEIGDYVDWWYHDCWWSAEVINVLGEGLFELKCPSPPVGEGGLYRAKESDMRPSVNWSLKEQWTIPQSKVPGNKLCVRLLGPVLFRDAFPANFLEPEDKIEEHVNTSKNEDKIQTLSKKRSENGMKRKRDSSKGNAMPRTKKKLHSRVDKQPQSKLYETSKYLEKQSEEEEQKVINRKIYPIMSSNEDLSLGDLIGPANIKEEERCDKQSMMTPEQQKHSLSYNIIDEPLKMAKVVDSSKHKVKPEINPKSGNIYDKTVLKKKHSKTKQKIIETGQVTSGQSAEVPKNVSSLQMKQKDTMDELSEALEVRGKNGKTGNKRSPKHKAALSYDTHVEDIHQPRRRLRVSSEYIEDILERASESPEIGVIFDNRMEKSQRNSIDGNKRKKLQEKTVEEARSIQSRERADPKKGSKRHSKHFESEKRALKKNAKPFEQDGGIRKEAKKESIENSKRAMKIGMKLKVEGDISARLEEGAIDKSTTALYASTIARSFHLPEIQDEKPEVHVRDVEFQTCTKQHKAHKADPTWLEPCQAEKKVDMKRNKKRKVLQDVSAGKTMPGQDVNTKFMRKSIADNGLSTGDKYKLHEPSAISHRSRITTVLPIGLLQGYGLNNRQVGLKVFPDRPSERSPYMSTDLIHDSILAWDTEGSNIPLNSNDVLSSNCGSPNSLSEGICLSSDVHRDNDSTDDNISVVGLDADSCSMIMKLGCTKEIPLEYCVQDLHHSRGLLNQMKPDTNHRLMDYSSLRRLVNKPVIKYKAVLSRKLVSTARRELWSKGKSFTKRIIF